jgi:hypothetical protein
VSAIPLPLLLAILVLILFTLLDTVIIAFIWLRVFEMKEEVVLNKNTVSVASYTVAVKGFQDGLEFTEQEIKSHFAEVRSHCSDRTNFTCLIWYNNNYYDVLFDRSRARR